MNGMHCAAPPVQYAALLHPAKLMTYRKGAKSAKDFHSKILGISLRPWRLCGEKQFSQGAMNVMDCAVLTGSPAQYAALLHPAKPMVYRKGAKSAKDFPFRIPGISLRPWRLCGEKQHCTAQ